jgi:hypothetical protein
VPLRAIPRTVALPDFGGWPSGERDLEHNPPMSGREERAAQNESASREINERLEEAHEGEPERYVRMVCECGRETCDRVIAITVAEYERVRSDPRQFAVVRDHVMQDVEQVVETTDRFTIVTKMEGTPAEVAIEEDPRA